MTDTKSRKDDHSIEYEIRFAVVMYGGVSLAIYINGVAQELLKMVRATSGCNKLNELKSTEKIYHQLGCVFSDKELLKELEDKSIEDIRKTLEDKSISPDCSPTRFVVDIISGTSAGGINGVFLAKALAKNQRIDELKELWLNEGDIGSLINDKKSVADINLSFEKKSKSLLNSQRMYLKLLEAIEAMDLEQERENSGKAGNTVPLVKELDLFITVTDYKGVSVPLRLLDGVVQERRYKHVFHFQHSGQNGKSDFDSEHNPMLAFASRCTSAFPFAFEPMRLREAESIIEEAFPDANKKISDLQIDEKDFFPKIKDKNGEDVKWKHRDLVDGGYLDNKPFSYAIDALSKRRADFQVERKLIYVEPSPENLGKESPGGTEPPPPPDALENAKAAVSELPRYETIREDLQRVLDRNRLIERIKRLVSGSENDIYTYLDVTDATKWKKTKSEKSQIDEKKYENPGDYWEEMGLENIVKLKGHAVLPYYRLRISSLTDEIAKLVSKEIGIDETSEYFLAIRGLVNVWRKNKFITHRKGKKDKKTVLAFLRIYDLDYRLRRLSFVQQKASQLFQFENDFRQILKKRQKQLANIRQKQAELQTLAKTKKDKSKQDSEKKGEEDLEVSLQSFVEPLVDAPPSFKNGKMMPSEIIWKMFGEPLELEEKTKDDDKNNIPEQNGEKNKVDLTKLRLVVNYFQGNLKKIFTDFQNEKENIFSQKADSSKFSKAIKSVKLDRDELKKLQGLTKFAEETNLNKEALRLNLESNHPGVYKQIERAVKELQKVFDQITEKARGEIKSLLKTKLREKDLPDNLWENQIEIELVNGVQAYLNHFYHNYDDFDQISFPAFYETQVGEAVKVDVLRISPLDAKSLIDEGDKKEKRRKLAGTSLFNFGAFLDKVWRKNDIMWGRLDGAERIITAILPDDQYENLRKYFAEEMNKIVLEEELRESDKDELRGLLVDSLINASAGIDTKDVVQKVTKSVSDQAVKKRLTAVLRTLLDEKFDELIEADQKENEKENLLLKYFRENYEVDRKTEPKSILRTISRATQVTGNVLEGVADKHGQSGSQLRWISRLGLIFWGLVEVAAPNTIWYKVFDHWLKLIYAFEVLLIIASTLFNKADVQQFGIVTLVLTIIINIAVMTLNDYMKGGQIWNLLRFLSIGLFLILCLSGAFFIFALFFQPDLWEKLRSFQEVLVDYERWQKLFPITIFILLFTVSFAWREFKKANIPLIGWVTLACVGAMIFFGFLFPWLTNEAGSTICFWDNTQGTGTKCVGKPVGSVLSLEFITSEKDILAIAGNDLNNSIRKGIQKVLLLDSFIFVPLYVGLLTFFSCLLTYRNKKWTLFKKYLQRKSENEELKEGKGKEEKDSKPWLSYFDFEALRLAARFALVIIILAGLSDLVENYFSYLILEIKVQEIPKWMINTIYWSATIKFGLIALTTLLFSMIFWRQPKLWKLVSISLVIISFIGFAGLYWFSLIPIFMGLLILMLAIISVGFISSKIEFFK